MNPTYAADMLNRVATESSLHPGWTWQASANGEELYLVLTDRRHLPDGVDLVISKDSPTTWYVELDAPDEDDCNAAGWLETMSDALREGGNMLARLRRQAEAA